MRRANILLLSATGLAGMAGPVRAACPVVTPVVKSLQPAGGQPGVPLNGVINFGTEPDFAGYSPQLTLTSGGAGATAGFLTSGPGGLWSFRPNGPLAPNTAYSFQIIDQSGIGSPASGSFTTGTGADLTTPGTVGTPSVTIDGYTPPSHDPTCDTPGFYRIKTSWQPASSDTPLVYALSIRVVDLNPNNQGNMTVLGQGVTAVTTSAYFNVAPYSGVGVSVYAINETGRETNSNIGTVNVPDAPLYGRAPGCGCDLASPAGGIGPLWLGLTGLIALLAVRFRREA